MSGRRSMASAASLRPASKSSCNPISVNSRSILSEPSSKAAAPERYLLIGSGAHAPANRIPQARGLELRPRRSAQSPLVAAPRKPVFDPPKRREYHRTRTEKQARQVRKKNQLSDEKNPQPSDGTDTQNLAEWRTQRKLWMQPLTEAAYPKIFRPPGDSH